MVVVAIDVIRERLRKLYAKETLVAKEVWVEFSNL